MVSCLISPNDDIHEMNNVTDRDTVEIHVYGKDLTDMPRLRFDVATKLSRHSPVRNTTTVELRSPFQFQFPIQITLHVFLAAANRRRQDDVVGLNQATIESPFR